MQFQFVTQRIRITGKNFDPIYEAIVVTNLRCIREISPDEKNEHPTTITRIESSIWTESMATADSAAFAAIQQYLPRTHNDIRHKSSVITVEKNSS